MEVKFPSIKQELIKLDEEDQTEVRGQYQALKNATTYKEKKKQSDLIAIHCHTRARRMLEILDEIKVPTIENVGLEGSKAISLLALHSYLEVMKSTLDIYEKIYRKDPNNIYGQAIPPLIDRILILENRLQLFGTNWSSDKYGKLFLIPVREFSTMNVRRSQFGLGPTKRPVILSLGATNYPLGKGNARASDQKELTDEEYEEYSKYHLKSMV